MRIVEDLSLGDHIAFFYRDVSEQLQVMMPYIGQGLERNERCLYIVDDDNVALITRHLEESGVNVEEEQSRGALLVTTKGETYLRHGVFEPARMIAELRDEVRRSVSMGFTGLRATGEMTWALDLPSALSSLLDYELAVSEEFPSGFMALCQYDETKFSSAIVNSMADLHPAVIRRGELRRQRPRSENLQHPTSDLRGTAPLAPRFGAAAASAA